MLELKQARKGIREGRTSIFTKSLKMSKLEDDLIEDLKRNYTKLGHRLYMCGISQIYSHYEGQLSISKIKDFLSRLYTYTKHKESHQSRQNPYFIRFKRQQWQIGQYILIDRFGLQIITSLQNNTLPNKLFFFLQILFK